MIFLPRKLHSPRSGFQGGPASGKHWNLEMLVFEERGNWSSRRKTSQSRVENKQQTQPTCDIESRNRTRATLVGGECFHHCANPAPLSVPLSLHFLCMYSQIIMSKSRTCCQNSMSPNLCFTQSAQLFFYIINPSFFFL